jgi:hypothetical protein
MLCYYYSIFAYQKKVLRRESLFDDYKAFLHPVVTSNRKSKFFNGQQTTKQKRKFCSENIKLKKNTKHNTKT